MIKKFKTFCLVFSSIIAALIVLGYIGYQFYDYHRMMEEKKLVDVSKCKKKLSTADGGLYTARYCFFGSGYVLLQVYKTKDNTMIADTAFPADDEIPFRLYWTKETLSYSYGDEVPLDGTIALKGWFNF